MAGQGQTARALAQLGWTAAAIVAVELVPEKAWIGAAVLAGAAWLVEGARLIDRRRAPRGDDDAWSGPLPGDPPWRPSAVLLPSDRSPIYGVTWLFTGFFLVSLLADPLLMAVAMAAHGGGDAAAGWAGRRYGRVTLVHGRTREGAAAFVVFGLVATLLALLAFHRDLSRIDALTVASGTAVVGAVAEQLCRRVDDNLIGPVIGASAAVCLAVLRGVPW